MNRLQSEIRRSMLRDDVGYGGGYGGYEDDYEGGARARLGAVRHQPYGKLEGKSVFFDNYEGRVAKPAQKAALKQSKEINMYITGIVTNNGTMKSFLNRDERTLLVKKVNNYIRNGGTNWQGYTVGLINDFYANPSMFDDELDLIAERKFAKAMRKVPFESHLQKGRKGAIPEGYRFPERFVNEYNYTDLNRRYRQL